MTNQILDTKAIEMLELTDQDLMAVNGGIAFLPLLIPAVKAAGTGAAAAPSTVVPSPPTRHRVVVQSPTVESGAPRSPPGQTAVMPMRSPK